MAFVVRAAQGAQVLERTAVRAGQEGVSDPGRQGGLRIAGDLAGGVDGEADAGRAARQGAQVLQRPAAEAG
jgi:hypothetical protein